MASSSKSNNVHYIRSISFPSEQLEKLKTWETSSLPTAEKINNGLAGLENLYKCMVDLLSLPSTQQVLSNQRNMKYASESLDLSMGLVDTCGSTRNFMSQVKEQVRDLQSALRRRKGDSSIVSSIAKYTSFKWKGKKEAKRLITALKQVDSQIVCSQLLDLDHHIASVIKVLREVSAVSITWFCSLLSFLSTPLSKTKQTKWSMVSKLIHKGATTSEELSQISNELESAERHIEGTESDLEFIFRSMVKTRASFKHVVSLGNVINFTSLHLGIRILEDTPVMFVYVYAIQKSVNTRESSMQF